MTVRAEVQALLFLGALPPSSAPAEAIAKHQSALQSVKAPISDEEARLMIRLFGPDECFGLAWVLLHLIESAPGWPIQSVLSTASGEWASRLRQRAANVRA